MMILMIIMTMSTTLLVTMNSRSLITMIIIIMMIPMIMIIMMIPMIIIIIMIPIILIIMIIPMITKMISSRFAADHDDWAISFLEGWQKMTTNGYSGLDLEDGPQSSWLGYESWTKGASLRRKVLWIKTGQPVCCQLLPFF